MTRPVRGFPWRVKGVFRHALFALVRGRAHERFLAVSQGYSRVSLQTISFALGHFNWGHFDWGDFDGGRWRFDKEQRVAIFA